MLPTAKPGNITEQDYYTAGDNTEMVAFIKQFQKQDPGYTVTRDVFPSGSAASQTLTEASAHQLPDLLMMDNPVMPELAASGDLVPLKSLGVNTSGLTEGAIAAGSYKGVQYGIGFGNNTIGLFYNKKLLSAAHVTPPATWAQLVTDAKILTKNGVAGFEVAADNVPGSAVWQFLPFFWTAGGDLEHVNNAGGVKALTLYAELAKEGALPTSVVDEQQNNTAVDFMAGKAAMIIMGPWEFEPFNATKGLSYGIAPVPVPSPGESAAAPLGGEVWVVPKSSPANEALGVKLLEFLTSPQSTYSWASQNGEIASQKSVSAALLAKVPQDKIFAEEIEHARSRTGEVGLAYSAIETALGTAVQAVILGRQTPTQALDTAEVAVKAALAQYHVG
jgi:multiple sugar transport system substrate-binding protein